MKYQKVTREEPGVELKKWSYSVRDIAQLLEIEESVAYDLVKRENLETVTIDYWKRIPKKNFGIGTMDSRSIRQLRIVRQKKNCMRQLSVCRKWQGCLESAEKMFMRC